MILLKAITFLSTLICIISASLLLSLSRQFVIFEYSRDNFPQDRYGISDEDRITYALSGLAYMQDWHTDKKALEILSSLKFQDTQKPVFTSNEISHLVDVKQYITLTRIFFILAFTTIISTLLHCLHHRDHLPVILTFMRHAALAAIGLVSSLALIIGFMWNRFFITFHHLLFPQGNWTFPQASSLIRLFPEIFWVDYAIFTIGIFYGINLVILLLSSYGLQIVSKKS